MQYQVPQFLDVEDKIIGPLTIKQFLFILGGAGGGYIIWKIIPYKLISFFPAVAFVVFSLALAFYKYNNKPLLNLVQSSFNYMLSNRLYIWKRREKKQTDELDLDNLVSTSRGPELQVTGKRSLDNLAFEIDAQSNAVEAQRVTPQGK